MFLAGYVEGPYRYGPEDEVPDFEQPVDLLVDDELLAAITAGPVQGIYVSCGRHDGRVYARDFIPRKGHRRRVIVEPAPVPGGSTDDD